MIPIYSPIKNYDYDQSKIKIEIDKIIKDRAVERTLPFKDGRSIYDSKGTLKIADDALLNNTSRYYLDDDLNRVYIPGEYKTYHVFNLTYLPEEPDSCIDIYRSDDPKKTIFWHKYFKPFVWREELENTYLKDLVESLPFEYVQGVRLIFMNPPSIGQIHRDSHTFANKKYFENGFASISLNIDSGGGILKFLDNDDKEHEVDNSVKMFHFDDSVSHGVTPITSPRYQIRIWGKLKIDYSTILDLDNAVLR
jgi:hypothetical protein